MMKGNLVKAITTDGLELAGFWAENHSEVAVFHSHGTAGDFYTHKFLEIEAERLASMGVSFLSANNRGHDVYADIRKHVNDKVEWAHVGGAFEQFEDCVYDISAWLDFLSSRGIKKIILQSHSLTQKILYFQNQKKDSRVVGQIHLSPCNDAGYMYYLLGEKKYKDVNSLIQKMLQEGRKNELLPPEFAVVCPMAAGAYSGYLTEDSVGNLFPYHAAQSAKWKMLDETADPLLAIFGAEDGFIKPSVQVAAEVFNAHTASAKSAEVKVINGASHSYIRFENALVGIIMDWIRDRNF